MPMYTTQGSQVTDEPVRSWDNIGTSPQSTYTRSHISPLSIACVESVSLVPDSYIYMNPPAHGNNVHTENSRILQRSARTFDCSARHFGLVYSASNDIFREFGQHLSPESIDLKQDYGALQARDEQCSDPLSASLQLSPPPFDQSSSPNRVESQNDTILSPYSRYDVQGSSNTLPSSCNREVTLDTAEIYSGNELGVLSFERQPTFTQMMAPFIDTPFNQHDNNRNLGTFPATGNFVPAPQTSVEGNSGIYGEDLQDDHGNIAQVSRSQATQHDDGVSSGLNFQDEARVPLSIRISWSEFLTEDDDVLDINHEFTPQSL